MPEYDSPWKEALEVYFELFLTFFFPQIRADIDWSRGYEFLDKELEKVDNARDACTTLPKTILSYRQTRFFAYPRVCHSGAGPTLPQAKRRREDR